MRFISKQILAVVCTMFFFTAVLPGQPGNKARLEKKAGEILDLLVNRKFNEITVMFDERLKEGLSARKLEQSWNELINQVGPYQGLEQISSEPYVGSTIVVCLVRFGGKLVDFKCRFNGAGNVSSLYFLPHNYVPPAPPEDTIRRE